MDKKIKIVKESSIDEKEITPIEIASCCIIKTINNLLVKSQGTPNIMYEMDNTIVSFGANCQEYERLKISFIMAACQFIEQNIYKIGD